MVVSSFLLVIDWRAVRVESADQVSSPTAPEQISGGRWRLNCKVIQRNIKICKCIIVGTIPHFWVTTLKKIWLFEFMTF